MKERLQKMEENAPMWGSLTSVCSVGSSEEQNARQDVPCSPCAFCIRRRTRRTGYRAQQLRQLLSANSCIKKVQMLWSHPESSSCHSQRLQLISQSDAKNDRTVQLPPRLETKSNRAQPLPLQSEVLKSGTLKSESLSEMKCGQPHLPKAQTERDRAQQLGPLQDMRSDSGQLLKDLLHTHREQMKEVKTLSKANRGGARLRTPRTAVRAQQVRPPSAQQMRPLQDMRSDSGQLLKHLLHTHREQTKEVKTLLKANRGGARLWSPRSAVRAQQVRPPFAQQMRPLQYMRSDSGQLLKRLLHTHREQTKEVKTLSKTNRGGARLRTPRTALRAQQVRPPSAHQMKSLPAMVRSQVQKLGQRLETRSDCSKQQMPFAKMEACGVPQHFADRSVVHTQQLKNANIRGQQQIPLSEASRAFVKSNSQIRKATNARVQQPKSIPENDDNVRQTKRLRNEASSHLRRVMSLLQKSCLALRLKLLGLAPDEGGERGRRERLRKLLLDEEGARQLRELLESTCNRCSSCSRAMPILMS